MATAMTSTTATAAAAATTSTSATSRTSSAPATIAPSISTTITTVSAVATLRSAFAIEVRLIRLIRKIAATFNHQCAALHRLALRCHCCRFSNASALRRHLRALLFQNRLAREPDAVALHCQDFHQHLVAFLQLVSDVGNPMLRHFADVQQALGARNDFDKRTKVRQSSNLPEISLPYLGRRRDVADNLQRLLCRRLIARRDFHQPGVFHID